MLKMHLVVHLTDRDLLVAWRWRQEAHLFVAYETVRSLRRCTESGGGKEQELAKGEVI